jgi:hypothetical protein
LAIDFAASRLGSSADNLPDTIEKNSLHIGCLITINEKFLHSLPNGTLNILNLYFAFKTENSLFKNAMDIVIFFQEKR